MTNENCLKDITCPKCGQEDDFQVTATSVFDLTDDGTSIFGDVEWTDESTIRCTPCGHEATVGAFTLPHGYRCHECGATGQTREDVAIPLSESWTLPEPGATMSQLLPALKGVVIVARSEMPDEGQDEPDIIEKWETIEGAEALIKLIEEG